MLDRSTDLPSTTPEYKDPETENTSRTITPTIQNAEMGLPPVMLHSKFRSPDDFLTKIRSHITEWNGLGNKTS